MASTSFKPHKPDVFLRFASFAEKIAFLDTLTTNTTTTSLDLKNSIFNAGNAEKLATALKVNTTLTSLSLAGANAGEIGTDSVIDAVAINSTIISLKASFTNCISTAVAQKIGTMLAVNSTLQSLVITDCHIDDETAIALTQTLGTNSTLKSLVLSFNRISSDGALKIGRVLSSNKTLTEMNFSGNSSIEDTGMSALIKAARLNPSLTALNISITGMTIASIPKVVKLIQTTSSLKTLDIKSLVHDDARLVMDITLAGIRDALFLNGTITSLYVIPALSTYITDASQAADDITLRNEHNLKLKGLSLFELMYDYLIQVAPDENFPISKQEPSEKNFDNPHRSSFVDIW